MKKLSKDHLIDGRVYPMGTEYEIIKEGSGEWPELTHRDWKSMTVSQLEQYLDSNDVNARTTEDRLTPLMFSSRYNSNRQVIQVLLDNGADIDARDEDGRTVLMLASAHNSNKEVIQTLIDNGADVNAGDRNGVTALMLASAHNSNKEVIQTLIDNGADVNAGDRNGVTALNRAYNYKRRDTAQLLIDNGATE